MDETTSFDLIKKREEYFAKYPVRNRERERQDQARVDALLEPYDDEFLDRMEALLEADPDLDIPDAINILKSQN